MSEILETVECCEGDAPDYSVIWLHGLGADGHDFEPVVPYLRVPGATLRFVFPHAPVRPVTLNGGVPMRAWFNIMDLDRQGLQDETGIRTSAAQVEALIQRENRLGIPDERIILAGFSQGGVIALHHGLRRPGALAGILALSTYLPLARQLESEFNPDSRGVPVFMAHGLLDPVLPLAWGEHARDQVRAAGFNVAWKTYEIPHAVCDEQIADIRTWLATLVGRRKS